VYRLHAILVEPCDSIVEFLIEPLVETLLKQPAKLSLSATVVRSVLEEHAEPHVEILKPKGQNFDEASRSLCILNLAVKLFPVAHSSLYFRLIVCRAIELKAPWS
jgi:hypothetical protein